MKEFKSEIIANCKHDLEGRIKAIESDLALLAADIAEDNKSSAGDKYETSREMANLERQKLAEQLSQNKKSLGYLINLKSANHNRVEAGALIETDQDFIFIAISFGLLEVAGRKVMIISPQAPLAQALLGALAGDQVSFNDRLYKVKAVY